MSLLSSCGDKKDKDAGKEKKKNEIKEPNFIGPGTFGFKDSKRPDTTRINVGVFVNPDTSIVMQTTLPKKCPFIYGITATKTVNIAKCDPKFDYSKMVQETEGRTIAAAKKIVCPKKCPFRKGYRDPRVDHYIEWSCIKTVTGGFAYSVTYTGYFVCTDTQN